MVTLPTSGFSGETSQRARVRRLGGVLLSGRGWSTDGTPGWTSWPGFRKLPLTKTWLVRGFSSSFMTRLLGEVNCFQKARSSESRCFFGVNIGAIPR